MIDYASQAQPREVTPDGIPVFCSFDKIAPLSELKPNPANPNTHGRKQLELLGDIIISTGWRAPITVSRRSGLITKGHGRLMAAQTKRLKHAPVEFQSYASEAEEHADLIADNRLAELSVLDNSKLLDMIQEMDTGELPLELTGYTQDDLKEIIAALEGADDTTDDKKDKEPEMGKETFSRPGDLWHLGSHRLICGSATNEKDIDRLMDGQLAQMVHTDPPYGVSYETQSGKFGMIKNDDLRQDDLMKELLVPAFKNYVRSTKDDAAFYIWHASACRRDFSDALLVAGLMEKQYIIWVKNAPVLGHADYQWAHEPCFYAEKAGHQAKFYGDRAQRTTWKVVMRGGDNMAAVLTGGVVLTDGAGGKVFLTDKAPKGKKTRYIRMNEGSTITLTSESKASTVWEVARESKTVHPTQKPVELPTRAILNSSEPGDIVLDFFGGSGSTLIAAEETGRICYTAELDPQYCDAIVNRYVEATGKKNITCERDGKEWTLDEIKAANRKGS